MANNLEGISGLRSNRYIIFKGAPLTLTAKCSKAAMESRESDLLPWLRANNGNIKFSENVLWEEGILKTFHARYLRYSKFTGPENIFSIIRPFWRERAQRKVRGTKQNGHKVMWLWGNQNYCWLKETHVSHHIPKKHHTPTNLMSVIPNKKVGWMNMEAKYTNYVVFSEE